MLNRLVAAPLRRLPHHPAPRTRQQLFACWWYRVGCALVESLGRLPIPIRLCSAPLPVLPPGFLPRIDPLRRLPQAELQPWEAMAVALPALLAVGQARKPLEALPKLSIGALLTLGG